MKTFQLNKKQVEERGLLIEKAVLQFGRETVEEWMQDPVKRRLINTMPPLIKIRCGLQKKGLADRAGSDDYKIHMEVV